MDSPDSVPINTIRTLVIDAVQAAQSGHPGAAMALAPVGHTLWNDVLRYDVDDPGWLTVTGSCCRPGTRRC